MYRGVYVNGQVHYLSVGSASNQQTVSHQAGAVDDSFSLTLGAAVTQNVDSCTPDCGLLSANGAVFDSKIFFVYTGNPGCTVNKKTGQPSSTHLYVITWDLTTGDFVRTNGANSPYAGPKDLGAVYRTDANAVVSNEAVMSAANAVIVVFNNLLYIIADNAIYTSGDGVNWSSCPALPVGGNYLEPLDAITFYPPDADPLIMVIYGNYLNSYYSSLYAATWNGQFGDASVLNGRDINTTPTSNQAINFSRCLGLFTGTATPTFSLQPGNDHNSAGGFQPGARTPSLQLFLGYDTYIYPGQAHIIRRLEYSYNSSGGTWTLDPEQFIPNGGYGYDYGTIHAFPWFTPICNPDTGVQTQHLVIDTAYSQFNLKQALNFTSDSMVPQNTDIPPTCSDPGGTATDTGAGTDEQNETLRKYWTLVGMVMGSPPFVVNKAQDFEIAELSNVTYGQSQTAEVSNEQETDNSVLVSAGVTVQGGIEHVFGIKDQLDYSYKHGWESAHGTSTSSTVSYGQTFGTKNASTDPDNLDKLGTMGWAFFHVPTIVVQNYALYAYDYNVNTNSGTSLNQNITTTQVKQADLSFRPAAFELANPGGPNDTYPGLLSGIAPLTKSTDMTGWTQGWESNSAAKHYVTLLGDSTAGETKINTISFVDGSYGSVSYSQERETIKTSGQTSDIEISNELSLDVGTELKGFDVDLKAGYDGHFSTSVTTTTTLGTDVEAAAQIPACYEAGCLQSLTVQPYLLQATDSSAPWIPTGYNGQLPWAMHWKIVSQNPANGNQSGVSPLPDHASGKVVGRIAARANAGEVEYGASGAGLGTVRGVTLSSYSLKGGKMAWLNPDGKINPIPMKAKQFVPALGASVTLNGYTWSSLQAKGKWVRLGNVWQFRTANSRNTDKVLLKLDFGRRTWDFDLSGSDLAPFMKATDGRAHLKLNVNGKHTFYFDCDHQVKADWDHTVPATDFEGLSLSRYRGSYDQSTGSGTASFQGTLPINLTHFGDFSISVNGGQIDIPLLTHDGYAKAFTQGKTLAYSKDGINLTVNFGQKTWNAQFTDGAFRPHLLPRTGEAMIQVKVGGQSWYKGKHAIRNYTSHLSYQ